MRRVLIVPGVLLACALASCGGTDSAHVPGAVVLASYEVSGTATVTGSLGGVLLEFGWIESDPAPVPLFFTATPVLIGGEEGVPFQVLPGTNALVDGHFARLTNGVDEDTCRGVLTFPGGARTSDCEPESVVLGNRVGELPGPDLVGATIERMVVTPTRVDITPGAGGSFDVAATVELLGSVD